MVGPTYNRALEVRLDRRILHINKSVLDLRCIDTGLLVAVHTLAHFSNGLLGVGIINRTVVCVNSRVWFFLCRLLFFLWG